MKKIFDFIGCALALGVSPTDKWEIFWRQTKNFRVRLRLATYHPQDTYILNTHFGRLTFRDNFGDITNLTNLLYRQVYRWKQLSFPGPILDVGANIGIASVWFKQFNPEYRIICFEPLPEKAAMIAGGAEALITGLNSLDRFAWVGAFSSGGLGDDYGVSFPGLDGKSATNLRLLWIACGKEDRLFDGNVKFIEWLKSKGIRATWVETPGADTWTLWRRYLSDFAPLLFQ